MNTDAEPAGPGPLENFREIEHMLGPDLWSLACSIPSRLTSATPLGGDNYPGYRSTAFRLEFADGRVLKGRQLQTPAQAETVEYVARGLGHRNLPRVLGRCGTALLSEWIDGRPLSAGNCDAQLLWRCGVLQATAHSLPLPPGTAIPPAPRAESLRTAVEQRLEELVELELLERSFASNAAAIAWAHAPQACASGFTYGDLCADNVVLHPSGDLYVVDTETLAIQPYDYDLGRTWYRWPMQRDDRQAFFEGYSRHRQLTDFCAHFPYWAIAAIVDSAVFRGRRAGAAAATVPLQRLNLLIRNLQNSAVAEDAVFLS
jgi:hypothetical protein